MKKFIAWFLTLTIVGILCSGCNLTSVVSGEKTSSVFNETSSEQQPPKQENEFSKPDESNNPNNHTDTEGAEKSNLQYNNTESGVSSDESYTEVQFDFSRGKGTMLINASVSTDWDIISFKGYNVGAIMGNNQISLHNDTYSNHTDTYRGKRQTLNGLDIYVDIDTNVTPLDQKGESERITWDVYYFSYIDKKKDIVYTIEVCNAGDITIDKMERFIGSFDF